MRSRQHWLNLDAKGVIEIEQCGSIHAAHRDDEMAVIEEFCKLGGHDVQLLSAGGSYRERAPIVNPEGLRGGMFSKSEMRANPRIASAQIAKYLQEQLSVECSFQTTVNAIENRTAIAADGRRWTAERIVVCSGSDLQTLYPDVVQNSGIRLCKLQMLKARQSFATKSMPHIASGLTLRHYNSFAVCPTLAALKQRVARETPELDRFGIHVMASTFNNGDILLGDSHEYDADISPFDKAEIDELMLRELRKIIRLDDWTIHERWHGIYGKSSEHPAIECELDEGVHACLGTGGAGMTMAFGLADRAWQRWMGEFASAK